MNRFNSYIEKAEPCEPLLPMVHNCEAYDFRSIMEECELSTSSYYDEMLLFLFYGKPAYRILETKQAVTLPAFMPVSILIKPDTIKALKRISPFDTGAFEVGLFKDHMHPEMKKEDFLLNPTLDMPQRIVKLFYGSNKDYFWGKPLSINVPSTEFEVQSYYSLIQEKGKTQFDDRCSTIEIQSDISIKLHENVLLVILPGIFLDDENVRDIVQNKWKADIIPYPIYHGDPKEFTGFIYSATADYLEKKGYIKR